MQLFSTFVSCWDVFTHPMRRPETWNTTSTTWDCSTRDSNSIDSSTTIVDVSRSPASKFSFQTLLSPDANHRPPQLSRSASLRSMSALEHTLKWNPEPLQQFAAHKDFSGENVNFLVHLAEWQQSWKFTQPQSFALPSKKGQARIKQRRRQYNHGIRIYAAFISMRHAEFPMNISAHQQCLLDDIFGRAAALLFGSDTYESKSMRTLTKIAPFAYPKSTASTTSMSTCMSTSMSMSIAGGDTDDRVWYWGPIPHAFDEYIFDAVEKEIRYLVLTNTWFRFVTEEMASCRNRDSVARRASRPLRRFGITS